MSLFLDLVQVSLEVRPCLSASPSGKEWEALYAEAVRQALTGVLWTGVERLPPEQRPPREVLLRWYAAAEQARSLNRRLNREAVAVERHLRERGFEAVILKGQGMAVLYPWPLSRVPGDIDVWAWRGSAGAKRSLSAERKSLLDLARERTAEPEGVTYCHVHYPLPGHAEVELHCTPSWMNCFRLNAHLQRFFAEEAPAQLGHTAELPEGAGRITVPTAEFNRFYILLHIYRHLFGEGIGLRQLMDFYFVLRQPDTAESRMRTLELLRHFGMRKFAAAVMYVEQRVFGLAPRYMLLPPDEREGRFLLDEIMQAGNFGRYDARIRRRAGEGAFGRFVRSLRRNARFLRHYPREILCDPCFRLWLYGWRKWHGWI